MMILFYLSPFKGSSNAFTSEGRTGGDNLLSPPRVQVSTAGPQTFAAFQMPRTGRPRDRPSKVADAPLE
jgi:hypothetical protein